MHGGRPNHAIRRLVVVAPNWLGDAVMALPAIADVKRALPEAAVTVAARAAVVPLFEMVAGVSVLDLDAGLAGPRFDVALLLPNSLRAALIARRAGIPERWGYRTDCRGVLLTRAIGTAGAPGTGRGRSGGQHQAAYYQRLVLELGFVNGPPEPGISVPGEARTAAKALLVERGWDGQVPLASIAPGAAYGGAKRWPPDRFALLAHALGRDDVQTVMVGSRGDRETADRVVRAFHANAKATDLRAPLDLVGCTDLAALAGVLATCRGLITNDSGAMHLAAAIGTPVTAVFGPTNEKATRPLGSAHTVIAHDTWCRPCMLRECPLGHECMRGIEVGTVLAAARRSL